MDINCEQKLMERISRMNQQDRPLRWKCLPGDFETCSKLHLSIIESAQRIGFSEEKISELEMAVGEICINIVEHAYKDRTDQPEICFEIMEYKDRLELSIMDYSLTVFPLHTAPVLTPEEVFTDDERDRGLGLYVIRTFVDKIDHEFVEGEGNLIRLVKLLGETDV